MAARLAVQRGHGGPAVRVPSRSSARHRLQGDRSCRRSSRSGSQLLDRTGAVIAQRRRGPSDGAVRHAARLGAVRDVVVVHRSGRVAKASRRSCSRSTTAAAGCSRTSCGSTSGSAADRLAVDGADGGDRVRRDLGIPRDIEAAGADDAAARSTDPTTARRRAGLRNPTTGRRPRRLSAPSRSAACRSSSSRPCEPHRRPRAAPRLRASSGSLITIGIPVSPPTPRAPGTSGTWAMSGTPIVSATSWPPPSPNSSSRSPQCGQMNHDMFSITPIGRRFVRSAILPARCATVCAASCGVVTTTIDAPGMNDASEMLTSPVPGRQVAEQDVEVAPVHVAEELLDRLVQHRPAPDHRGVLRHEEPHRDHLHAVGLQRQDHVVEPDRLALGARASAAR